ncbi:MAG: NAD(P)H-dependent oxidoreductase [Paracoccus sp. (in: a-proteobacteria)]|nr:NAD(P)H-dependent oxidoreductase [Paracoccus sp. (in: a-proteobacteria)]
MKGLPIDGHPDRDRLSAHLADLCQQALPAGAQITRLAIRDMDFCTDLPHGHDRIPEWEPDRAAAFAALHACDHLVLAFPLWWGAEPARLKGFWERIPLPGHAFRDHEEGPLRDRLLAGRSADLLVTMNRPPLVLWLFCLDPLGRRYKRFVLLGFTGFSPIRLSCFGPVRRKKGAQRNLARWQARTARLAGSAEKLKRKEKA